MAVEKFEDLIVWQKAINLSLYIYKIFSNCRDFGFRNQIQRAGISISNNIAEGFERKSNKEFIYFLYVSKGSSGEVRSMSYLATKLKYINIEQYNYIKNNSIEISKMIHGLIKTL